MATKTATKKKSSTGAKKSTTTVKRSTAKNKLPIGIYKENYPEDHVATGKYKFFFVLFGIMMVLFAAISVWLWMFSSELLIKYQKIETCARNGESCEVRVNYNVEPEVDAE